MNERFLKACRRQPVDCTPVWFMRQAGRYMREYQAVRAKHSILEVCKTPDLAAQVTLQPTARFNESVSYNRVTFDRLSGGARVYTVDVLNTKTTFQVDRRFSLRAIVQYESSRSRILTDLLASWELRPCSVAYAGYGSLVERQEWDGMRWLPGQGSYTTTNRGFFFKASYIHRF